MVGDEWKVKGLCRNTVTDDGGVDWSSLHWVKLIKN
jgi:hypothetical protein